MTVDLQINGEPISIVGPMTVLDLIKKLGLEPRKLAVERNLEIVPKSAYGDTVVADGDRFEIVHFVGGG